MRKIVASAAALAAAIAFTAPAFAQEMMGTIKTYRSGDRIIILEDGTQYYISEGVKVREYQPGAKVKNFVVERNGKRYITRFYDAD